MRNKNEPLSTNQNAEHVRSLYDQAPYPESLAGSFTGTNALLLHWVNAVGGPNQAALNNNSKILVAGCGTGSEVFMLANLFPGSQVVGVDFSEKSIEIAQEKASKNEVGNAEFEVADLMNRDWAEKYEKFDFILCHGVADYVLDPGKLMVNLGQWLSDKGVILMMVNGPQHPSQKVKNAFTTLGQSIQKFEDNAKSRSLLSIVDVVMGDQVRKRRLGDAPKAYLDIDIFAPIAHHDSLTTWCRRAQESGLHFGGSLEAQLDLNRIPDEHLPTLYSLGKSDLSLFMENLSSQSAMQLLFSRIDTTEPVFQDWQSLLNWKPTIDSSLSGLPAMELDPREDRQLKLGFPGLPPFIINTTAFDLEILRNCNGARSLNEILAEVKPQGDLENLQKCLFRAYHYGLLV